MDVAQISAACPRPFHRLHSFNVRFATPWPFLPHSKHLPTKVLPSAAIALLPSPPVFAAESPPDSSLKYAPSLAGLAGTSLGKPQQEQQLLRVPSLPLFREAPSRKMFPSPAAVSRIAVGTAPRGLSPTAELPSALPDSDRSMPDSTEAAVSRASAVGIAPRGFSPTTVVLTSSGFSPTATLPPVARGSDRTLSVMASIIILPWLTSLMLAFVPTPA